MLALQLVAGCSPSVRTIDQILDDVEGAIERAGTESGLSGRVPIRDPNPLQDMEVHIDARFPEFDRRLETIHRELGFEVDRTEGARDAYVRRVSEVGAARRNRLLRLLCYLSDETVNLTLNRLDAALLEESDLGPIANALIDKDLRVRFDVVHAVSRSADEFTRNGGVEGMWDVNDDVPAALRRLQEMADADPSEYVRAHAHSESAQLARDKTLR